MGREARFPFGDIPPMCEMWNPRLVLQYNDLPAVAGCLPILCADHLRLAVFSFLPRPLRSSCRASSLPHLVLHFHFGGLPSLRRREHASGAPVALGHTICGLVKSTRHEAGGTDAWPEYAGFEAGWRSHVKTMGAFSLSPVCARRIYVLRMGRLRTTHSLDWCNIDLTSGREKGRRCWTSRASLLHRPRRLCHQHCYDKDWGRHVT
ncbi:hypothetical protein K438DRAFT_194546 [Mycena galopus ATCC 62051]|nr:hypothetical protein K438DRAFT_194546 [Mycena galopus ATCC 62051]